MVPILLTSSADQVTNNDDDDSDEAAVDVDDVENRRLGSRNVRMDASCQPMNDRRQPYGHCFANNNFGSNCEIPWRAMMIPCGTTELYNQVDRGY